MKCALKNFLGESFYNGITNAFEKTDQINVDQVYVQPLRSYEPNETTAALPSTVFVVSENSSHHIVGCFVSKEAAEQFKNELYANNSYDFHYGCSIKAVELK